MTPTMTNTPTTAARRQFLGVLFVVSLLVNSLLLNATPAFALTLRGWGGHPAETEMLILHANGVISVHADGSFGPDESITRAELVRMMVYALRLGGEAGVLAGADLPTVYTDVSPSHWFLPYLLVAYERDLIRGYEDGSFRGNRPVTRAELSVVLQRALPPELPSGGELSFSDAAQIPSWAQPAVATLVGEGLIRDHAGPLDPRAEVTRAEAVVKVCRLMAWRLDHLQLRGTLQGWLPDRHSDEPRALVLSVDSLRDVVVRLAPSWSVMSGSGIVRWDQVGVGTDIGLVLDQWGRLRLLVFEADGEHVSPLDTRYFLKPAVRDGGPR